MPTPAAVRPVPVDRSQGVDRIDAVVIGAGVVGLACAVALGRQGHEVLVLDRGSVVGSGTTSRNSEVVHAGIYYPTGSLKHRFCVEGRRSLYSYMAARGVAHRRCGKLIVATTPDEMIRIEELYEQGLSNDVEGLSLLTADQARDLEPELSTVGALISRETGILDSHGLLMALQGDLESLGGMVVLNTSVEAIRRLENGDLAIEIGGPDPMVIATRFCINAAGLHAQELASRTEGLDRAFIPELILAKGSYFAAGTRPAFSRLIYPAPIPGGLGVHLTLDLAGQMRFGPDVEWLDHSLPDQIDYHVDPARADLFYAAIRRYWPSLPDGVLRPEYSGCRPKVQGGDFRLDGPEHHGVPGLVNLFGIESPGLTSSLAIAEAVAARLQTQGPARNRPARKSGSAPTTDAA